MAETGFIAPTLAAVRSRVVADIDSNVTGADSRLRKTALRAIAVTLSGVSWALHKFGSSIAREILPDCASATGLKRWKRLFRLPDVQAIKSQGAVLFTGTDTTPIPSGTEVVRNDGVAYATTVVAIIGSVTPGEVSVAVEAIATGSDGDAEAGQLVTLTEPISGVDSAATVDTGGIVGGVDVETTEQLRIRVLERMALAPQSGAVADYVRWTREATAGVRDVFVGVNEPNLGHVTIRFTVEPEDGDPANAIPSTAQVDAVQDYIGGTVGADPFDFADAASPAPAFGDRIDVRELTAAPTTFAFSALSPNSAAVQAAIEAALMALMLQRGEPGGTITLDQWIGAVDAAPGEDSATLSQINGVAAADVIFGADEFPTFGSASFP
jgi:uncharacterized phage protein gp47/JayE